MTDATHKNILRLISTNEAVILGLIFAVPGWSGRILLRKNQDRQRSSYLKLMRKLDAKAIGVGPPVPASPGNPKPKLRYYATTSGYKW
jgi:hypothetical protein